MQGRPLQWMYTIAWSAMWCIAMQDYAPWCIVLWYKGLYTLVLVGKLGWDLLYANFK